MPMYDRICLGCGHKYIDCYEPIAEPVVTCLECGGPTERAWLEAAPGVIDDSIPGGIEIKHGLCHPDGTPRKFYSHTEINRAAKAANYVNAVEHVPSHPGTDKAKWTTRWV